MYALLFYYLFALTLTLPFFKYVYLVNYLQLALKSIRTLTILLSTTVYQVEYDKEVKQA